MPEKAPYHIFDRFLRTAKLYEEPWRKENEMNFRYCDGQQWSPKEMDDIRERGQQPTVINTILPTVDMICSVAENRQTDIQIVGREESDDQTGTLLTALLRHVFDVANFEYYHLTGFRNALIGGRAWFEVVKHTDERGKDLIRVDLLPWENVYLDPFSRKPDASDARFIIKTKWVDRDMAKFLFPEAADLINSTFTEDYKGQEYEAQMHSAGRGEYMYFDQNSNRVRICECYYTMPEKRTVKILNEETGKEEQKQINVNAVHYVIFSDDIILQGSATNHKANKNPLDMDLIPLIPMYCLRDSQGRPRGIVKSLIDIQDQINKLNSKFLWTLMTNRILAEEGALRDPDEARIEMQRPDGLLVLNDGGLSKVRIDEKYRDLSYMSNHLNFLLATEQRISGVNDSMLGLGGTNERSGVMQNVRINQGAAMQTTILDNMNFSKQRIAYVVLRMIGKYYTDYRVVRITQPNGTTDSYEFNKPVIANPQQVGQIDPQTGKPIQPQTQVLNRIEDTLYYDVILKKVPPFTSVRSQMLTIFSEVIKSGVIPAPIAAELMLQLSDIPNKQDIIYKIQQFYQQQAEAQAQAAQAQAAQAQAQQGGAEQLQMQ